MLAYRLYGRGIADEPILTTEVEESINIEIRQ